MSAAMGVWENSPPTENWKHNSESTILKAQFFIFTNVL